MLFENYINSESETDLKKLQKFLDENQIGRKTFRYYEKRDLKVINNHICTILFEDNGESIGYGHLDKENDVVWLGIMVGDNLKGKGYGKKILSQLITKINNDIFLTVDKDNHSATSLYKKFGFVIIEEKKHYYKMNLKKN